MGLFRSGPSSAQLALSALQAENADLRAQLLRERTQYEEERRHLIDRLLALTNPPALREVRRTPQGDLLSPAKHQTPTQRRLPPYPPPRAADPPTLLKDK
jgi:hypothetical protein